MTSVVSSQATPHSTEAMVNSATPTMKVRRARIEKVAEPHVHGWYATGRRVHWH